MNRSSFSRDHSRYGLHTHRLRARGLMTDGIGSRLEERVRLLRAAWAAQNEDSRPGAEKT